ncbi:MAG: heavy-metal-associated domain-containing protein [Nitrospinae bacterium]|nr:heavy-metal-associated domain-containing protein [Nitrospinota bacterium]
MASKIVDVEGMSCGHCVHHVTEALKGVAGVVSVSVSLNQNKAMLETTEEVSDDALRHAVEEAGYTVTAIS